MLDRQHTRTRYAKAFFAQLAAVTAFRAWFITTLPLSGDEAYHWEWSRHLALGYYDHPGLTAYLIALSTLVFRGSSEFSVRLPAVLLLAGTAWVGFAMARRVCLDRGGTIPQAERAGLLAGFLLLVVPVFALFSVYMSTDPPVIFFATATLYAFYRACVRGRWTQWIGAGLLAGLCLLSKFLAVFLLVGLGLFMLLDPPSRRWLRRPHPYVCGAVALAVFSPFLWWNATHGWATFVFNLVRRQPEFQLRLDTAGEYILGQVVALSPALFVYAVGAAGVALREGFRRRNRPALCLGLCAAVPIGYFFFDSFLRHIGPHWPTAGWAAALVWMSALWVPVQGSRLSRARRGWRVFAVVLCVLITATLHAAVHVPPSWIQRAWSYWGQPDKINTSEQSERFGWRTLGKHVEDVRNEMLGQDPSHGVFIICRQYGMAAAVAFYTPNQLPTHLWTTPKVHGENYRFWDDFRALKGQDALFVAKRASHVDGCLPGLRTSFARVADPERLPIVVDGREVRAFYLVRCYGFNGSAP